MTDNVDSVKRAHEEHLMAAFAVVLTHPAGFGIELFAHQPSRADLWINRVADGQFRVGCYDSVKHTNSEELFHDVRDAINYYLDLRDDLQVGNDYEPPT